MSEFEQYLIESFGETWERGGIMDAHNAALAAERERCDEIWRIGKAELAAEREKATYWELRCRETREQLAASAAPEMTRNIINERLFVPHDTEPEPKTPTTGDLEARITEYLAAGGLFNPELMEHEKVRDMLMDCREALAAERERYEHSIGGLEDLRCEIQQLREQIAAEKDKVERLVIGLHRLYALRDPTCHAQAERAYEMALKVKEGKV